MYVVIETAGKCKTCDYGSVLCKNFLRLLRNLLADFEHLCTVDSMEKSALVLCNIASCGTRTWNFSSHC